MAQLSKSKFCTVCKCAKTDASPICLRWCSRSQNPSRGLRGSIVESRVEILCIVIYLASGRELRNPASDRLKVGQLAESPGRPEAHDCVLRPEQWEVAAPHCRRPPPALRLPRQRLEPLVRLSGAGSPPPYGWPTDAASGHPSLRRTARAGDKSTSRSRPNARSRANRNEPTKLMSLRAAKMQDQTSSREDLRLFRVILSDFSLD